jgi:transmembrane sensor
MPEPMTSKDELVRATIAEQASEWFVANDEAPLGIQESTALVAWLKASPVHVEEFLGVAAIARDLPTAGTGPESSLDTLLARARAEEEDPVQSFWSGVFAAVRDVAARRWHSAAVSVGAVGVASLGLLLWNLRPIAPASPPDEATALHFQTRHGEQQTHRLADNSVLHLNTDSAVTVRYSQTQRVVVLTSGEAEFEVTHEPKRAFRVLAGPAEIVDLGTQFDVRLRPDSTVVAVIAGRVAVKPSPMRGKGGVGSSQNHLPRSVRLGANQQISVAEGQWPAIPTAVDAQRTTAWLHRQIVFDHEPLEQVAAEFNRYALKPIEITAPELRGLEVSGIFSTDDTEEFLAFLRSLEGVRVDVTATQIRVSQK